MLQGVFLDGSGSAGFEKDIKRESFPLLNSIIYHRMYREESMVINNVLLFSEVQLWEHFGKTLRKQ